MKKISAIIVLLLMLCVLAGCGGNSDAINGKQTESESASLTEGTAPTESEESETLGTTESESPSQSETDEITETEPITESESPSEPQSETQTETQPDSDTQTDTEPDTDTNTEPDTEPDTETDTETETQPGCSHSFGEWVLAEEPTCTTSGKYERECSLCGETEEKLADTLDHTYGEWTLVGEPGCTDAREYIRECACGDTQTRADSPIGHKEKITNAKLPTESETGHTEKIECEVCGEILSESVTVPALTTLEANILADVTYVGNTGGELTFYWKTTEEYNDKLLGMRVSVTDGANTYDYEILDHDGTWKFQAYGNIIRFIFTFTPITVDGVQGDSLNRTFYWFPDTYDVEMPRVEVYTLDGELPTFTKVSPPPNCWGGGITDANYVQSIVSLYSKDNTLLYTSISSGYDGAKIKVRGNTSAYSSKQPFKIKLSKKFDLLSGLVDREEGTDYRNKDWLLMKSGYNTNIAVGSAISELVGNDWTPQYSYVTLFVNGEYRGIYILMESVDDDEARCNISDSGYIVEMDAYWWNEPLYFTTPISENRAAKLTFKYPDSDELTADDDRVVYIQQYLTDLENVMLGVQEGDINDYLDMESFVKWMLTHDILASWDSGGTNMYMTKYDNTESSKIKMGPVWDFDSIYWSQQRYKFDTFARIRGDGHFYMKYLSSHPNFIEIYWEEYNKVRNDIYSTISSVFEQFDNDTYRLLLAREKSRWGSTYEDPAVTKANVLDWVDKHLLWMDENVPIPEIKEEESEKETHYDENQGEWDKS